MKSSNLLKSIFRTHACFRQSLIVVALFMGLNIARTVHAQSSNPVSISPSSSSGSQQTFVATYTNPNGEMNIQSLSLFIMNGVAPDSGSGWPADQCVLNYTIASGAIQMVQDTGGAFLSNSAIAGTDQTVSNSRCTVLANLSSANISGNSVVVRFYVTFTEAFRGPKQLYLSVKNQQGDNITSFAKQAGSYNVTASVSSLFVSPASGTGSEQTFMTVYSDETNPVKSVFFNLKSSANNTSAASACKLRYDLDTDDISLVNDAGTHYSSPITSGSTTNLSNSQCTVYGVGTSATTFGNFVIAYFKLSFAAGFDGEKEMTMFGEDETGTFSFSNSPVGTYTVTAPPPIQVPNFMLTNTAVSIEQVGVPTISTITVTPEAGFIGNVALTCTVISPATTDYPPTCAFAAPSTISVTAETTATLVVNTTPASTVAPNNSLHQISIAAGGIIAAVLLPILPLRWRWQPLLCLLVLATIAGAAGCSAVNSRALAPINPGAANPGTAAGDYIVAVTGTSGTVTAATAVSVSVK